jgi:replicative DNA helicase
MTIETNILSQLINSESYARKVLPFLKEEYFQTVTDRLIVTKIKQYMEKYNVPPSKEALIIELDDEELREVDYNESVSQVERMTVDEDTNEQWLIDKTEEFCQEKAVYNAIMESIHIIDGKSKDKTKTAIPQVLSEALAVSFDNHIGHDFIEDYQQRFDFYHHKEERVPFDLEYMNKITKGGIPRKSLNIILAGTGVGKSLAMCHFAASNMMQGKNVLYITMEMAEEKIAERIDANLLNVRVDDLVKLEKSMYDKKIADLRARTPGRLIIKEYPTASAHSGHFRHLINELKIKRNFIPDIIYIDYLNICASSRTKAVGGTINSYTFVKAIAEELRGLAVEKNVPIVSATQTTRAGFGNSDVGLEDTSESFGLPATADFMFAIINSDEMEQLNQLMVKQLKNRYNDPTLYKRFVIGVDRAKMRLYDVEQNAQQDIVDDGPVMDNTQVGKGLNQAFGKPKKDFSDLWV